jgi:hypothetical protein
MSFINESSLFIMSLAVSIFLPDNKTGEGILILRF